MNWAQAITEAGPSLDWRRASLISRLVYARAFAAFGAGSVIVRPRKLKGVDRIRVGRECAIYPGAWLQCEPGAGELVLGDRVYLGHDVHLHAIDSITVGDGCVLADGVFVATTDHDRADRHGTHGTGEIRLGCNVFVGQRAMILGGVTIGDGATIGAGAVVTKDVPAGGVAVGIPARLIGGGQGTA